MPAVTLDKSTITKLGSTYKVLSTLDFTYFALQFDKDPSNSTQNIDADLFNTNWGISNEVLFAQLQALERKKVIKINAPVMTVTWSENEQTTMSQAEVLEMYSQGLCSATTFVYYALLLTKGAGLVQQVDPATYAMAPWNISGTTLMTELNNLSLKKNVDKTTPLLTLDLGEVTIIWLV